MTLSLDPFAPSVLADPYPWYAQLRAHAPCVHDPLRDVWLVSRHTDVVAVLRDPARFSSREGAGYVRVQDAERGGILISSDPPRHTRIRRFVQSAFGADALASFAPLVEARAEQLVTRALAAGTVDAMRALAAPLPILVASTLLGLPADEGTYAAWSDAVFQTMGPQEDGERGATEALLGALIGFLLPLVFERRVSADGLAARILEQVGTTDGLSEGEAVSLIVSIFAAGIDTTVHAIGNGLAAFAAHPSQWARLRAEPSLLDRAVEEVLRYDAPIQAFFRTAVEPVSIAGTVIPAGARVMALFGAANRDAQRFDDADSFDVGREPSGQLAFGAGIHLCLGAPLARMELRALFAALARSARSLRVVEAPVRRSRAVVRGYESVPLELGA